MHQENQDPGNQETPVPAGRIPPRPPGGEKKAIFGSQTRRIDQAGAIPPFSGILEPHPSSSEEERLKEEFTLPRAFGNYILLEQIGRGGMGVVFLARDNVLNRKVALKILRPETLLFHVQARERFRREAQAAAKLDHPGICPVYEVGEIDELPFMAMRYLEGETLAEITEKAKKEGRLPDKLRVAELLQVGEKVARALHAAHEAGLVHRDVKPANVMIEPSGEPVLLDFGLARDTSPGVKDLTMSMALVGTPHYLPPERLDGGKAPPDRRSDIYSLGATLYEAFTLKSPFEGETLEELKENIRKGILPDPRKLNPAVPRDLALVLAKAMDKNPARRYQDALSFAEDLRRVRTYEPVQVRPAGPLLKTARWAQRNPILATSLGGIFLALLVGFLSTYFLLKKVQAAYKETRAMALLASSRENLGKDERLSFLFARAAYRLHPSTETFSNLFTTLLNYHLLATVQTAFYLEAWNRNLTVSPGGRRILLPSPKGYLDLLTKEGKRILSIPAKDFAFLGKRGASQLEFSPRGDLILAGGRKGIFLWDLEGRMVTRIFPEKEGGPGDSNAFLRAWFDKDGRHLVLVLSVRPEPGGDSRSTGSHPPSNRGLLAQVRRLDGTILRTFQIARYGTQCYGFHKPTNTLWAIPKAGPTLHTSPLSSRGRKPRENPVLHLWTLQGKDSALVLPTSKPVIHLGFSPTRKFIAFNTMGRTKEFILMDRGGRILYREKSANSGFKPFCFSPDEKKVALAYGSYLVEVIPIESPRPPVHWVAHSRQVKFLAFSPTGGKLLTGSENGIASLWNLEGKRLAHLKGHQGPIIKVGFLGEDYCYTLGEDSTFRTWRLKDPDFPWIPKASTTRVSFFLASPGDRIFLIAKGGGIEEWDPRGIRLRRWKFPGRKPSLLYGDRRGRNLLVSGMDKIPRFLDTETGTWTAAEVPPSVVYPGLFEPGGEVFLGTFTCPKRSIQAMGRKRTLHLFTHRNGRWTLASRILESPLHIDILPSGEKILCVCGQGEGILILDRSGRILEKALAGYSPNKALFLDGGKRIVVQAKTANRILLLDGKCRVLRTLGPFSSTPTDIAPRPDGRAFLYSTRGGELEVLDSEGRLVRAFRVADLPIQNATFSPDGKKIIYTTPRSFTILDARTGKTLLYYRSENQIRRAGFTPSGRKLWLQFSHMPYLRILSYLEKDILKAAEEAARQGFTPREREVYRALLEKG